MDKDEIFLLIEILIWPVLFILGMLGCAFGAAPIALFGG